MRRLQRSVFIVALGAGTLCAGALGSTSSFQTGRFLSGGNEVRAGLFGGDVTIDTLTIGDATYRVERSELMHAMTVRVYADTDGDGELELLSDEAMASGRSPVALAVARELDASAYSTSLSAMQGLSLAHMLYSDGSSAVRMDVLLATGTYDDRPLQDDAAPEALLVGSFDQHRVTITAIIAGNVDEPVLGASSVTLEKSHFDLGRTGMNVLTHNSEKPLLIAIVGLDQSGDLGVEEGIEVLGYRVEIAPGEPAMFNILGATFEGQQALAREELLLDEDEDVLGGALGGGGRGGGGGGLGRVNNFSSGGFRGSDGGGRGGRFGPFDFDFDSPSDDGDSDDKDSSPDDRPSEPPSGDNLFGNDHPIPPGDVLHGDNLFELDITNHMKGPDDPKPPSPSPTPVPGPGGIGILLVAFCRRSRRQRD